MQTTSRTALTALTALTTMARTKNSPNQPLLLDHFSPFLSSSTSRTTASSLPLCCSSYDERLPLLADSDKYNLAPSATTNPPFGETKSKQQQRSDTTMNMADSPNNNTQNAPRSNIPALVGAIGAAMTTGGPSTYHCGVLDSFGRCLSSKNGCGNIP